MLSSKKVLPGCAWLMPSKTEPFFRTSLYRKGMAAWTSSTQSNSDACMSRAWLYAISFQYQTFRILVPISHEIGTCLPPGMFGVTAASLCAPFAPFGLAINTDMAVEGVLRRQQPPDSFRRNSSWNFSCVQECKTSLR